MSPPTGTTLTERTEWVFDLGEPRVPSRRGLAIVASLAVFFVGALLWYAPARGWEGIGSSPILASVFLWLWLLTNRVGAFLGARRGVSRGRGLRAFGYATFLPVSMALYLAYYWSSSILGFVVLSSLVGFWVVWTVFRLVRLTWRSG